MKTKLNRDCNSSIAFEQSKIRAHYFGKNRLKERDRERQKERGKEAKMTWTSFRANHLHCDVPGFNPTLTEFRIQLHHPLKISNWLTPKFLHALLLIWIAVFHTQPHNLQAFNVTAYKRGSKLNSIYGNVKVQSCRVPIRSNAYSLDTQRLVMSVLGVKVVHLHTLRRRGAGMASNSSLRPI